MECPNGQFTERFEMLLAALSSNAISEPILSYRSGGFWRFLEETKPGYDRASQVSAHQSRQFLKQSPNHFS